MYELITPCSCDYVMAKNLWNRAIDLYPSAICYCHDTYDVEQAVCYAVNNGLKIRIRSGGHSYEGFSSLSYGFVIDVSQMNQITMNLENQTVTIQAGATNAAIYHFIGNLGYPFPGGTCPSVSISGFTLGGGWGYSSRKYGLGIDSLQEIKMITYEGKLLTTNTACNPDLFWGCRGGGTQNFGVVTEYTFKLWPKESSVLMFELTALNVSLRDQIEFLDIWQQFIPTADRNINMNGGIYHSAANGYYSRLRGLFYGTEEQLRQVVSPFTSLNNFILTVHDSSMIQNIDLIFATYPPYDYFKSGGRFVNQMYSLSTLTALAQIIRKPLPQGSVLTSVNVFGLGGAVSDVSCDATAFYYRDSYYILQVQSVYASRIDKLKNDSWVIEQYQYLQTITSGSYVNFPFTPLDDYMTAYYGANKQRLAWIKQKYDPCCYFHYEQGIPCGI